MIRILSSFLDYNLTIQKRDNIGGAVVSEEILKCPCANVNFQFIADTVFLSFESIPLSQNQIESFEQMVNTFTSYLQINGFLNVKVHSVFSGRTPYFRYLTNSYVQSLIPIPNHCGIKSPFDYFLNEKSLKKRLLKIRLNQWFSKPF